MQRMILCATQILGAVRYLTCRTFLFKYYNFKKIAMIMFYFIALEIYDSWIIYFGVHYASPSLIVSKEEG